ncbi:hypothetical protein Tco_0902599 [Tanacetum coccineum]
MHELETCSFPARFGEVQLSLVGGSGDLKDLADSSPMEVRSWRPKQDTPKADAPVICIWERGNLLRGMNQVGKYDAAGRELDVVVGQAVYAVEGRAILDMPRMRSSLSTSILITFIMTARGGGGGGYDGGDPDGVLGAARFFLFLRRAYFRSDASWSE